MKWNPGNAVVPCSPDPACRSNLGYWLKRERVLTGNARCGTGRRLPRARLLPVVIRLQTQPETRARTEKTGQSESAVSAVIARLPAQIAEMRASGTPIAFANLYWLSPNGIKNSSRSKRRVRSTHRSGRHVNTGLGPPLAYDLERIMAVSSLDAIGTEVTSIYREYLAGSEGFSSNHQRCIRQVHRLVSVCFHQLESPLDSVTLQEPK
jgi:hypothetical protein